MDFKRRDSLIKNFLNAGKIFGMSKFQLLVKFLSYDGACVIGIFLDSTKRDSVEYSFGSQRNKLYWAQN